MYSFEYYSDFLLPFHRFQYVLLPLDVAFTIFFIIEMIIKIKYFGKTFFKDKECVFDLSIVVISTIPLFSLDWIQVMRLTRIFKSLRLIPNYKKLLINFRLVIRSCIGILVGLSILIFLLFCLLYMEVLFQSILEIPLKVFIQFSDCFLLRVGMIFQMLLPNIVPI